MNSQGDDHQKDHEVAGGGGLVVAEVVAELTDEDGEHHRQEVVEQRARQVPLKDENNDDIHGGLVAVPSLRWNSQRGQIQGQTPG